MRSLLGALACVTMVACGSSTPATTDNGDAAVHKGADASHSRDSGVRDAPHSDTRAHDSGMPDVIQGGADGTGGDVSTSTCAGGCPSGYACGAANGIPVCRAKSGVPLFSHVFLIMEENTSLSTLEASVNSNAAPNFASIQAKYASGTGYHGVSHPSLPNYIALTSGGPQGIGCDCEAQPGQGSCSAFNCNLALGSCTCTQSVVNLADQLETASKTWMAFGEGMGEPCNFIDDSSTNYAVRHVPFLYYDDIQSNANRCTSHVIDYASFKPDTAPEFTYIAPNLIDDMHNPVPATQGNITSGDNWIGPVVAAITASSNYTDGGLFVIVWDEDDDSGGLTGSNDPVPIFVLSPYAKNGGYMSPSTMDHYSLLATIEDGLNLPRLGNAGIPRPSTADTLADYFPAN